MSKIIKAHLFWMPSMANPNALTKRAVEVFCAAPKPVEFTHDAHDYLGDDLEWDALRGQLTGVVYKRRSHGLPKKLVGTTASDLGLRPGENLGEPMCFAMWPDPGVALVHYSHHGPRHTTLPQLLSAMGGTDDIVPEPVLRTGMLKKLDETDFVSAFEIALNDPAGVKELRDAGGAVGFMARSAEDLSGVTVRMLVTLGREKGRGLMVEKVRQIGRSLLRLAASDPEGGRVRTIKIKGAGSDGRLEQLDLLNARTTMEFLVDDRSIHLDTLDLRKKLSKALFDCRPMLLEQIGPVK